MRVSSRLTPWFLALVVVAAVLLVTTGRKPPRLPGDRDHALDQAEERCLSCHAHGARNPRPADHPLRDACFSCHRDQTGTLHPRAGAPTSLPGGWRDDPRLARRMGADGLRGATPKAR
jgi:predicted CXXCH cytochrome family protein